MREVTPMRKAILFVIFLTLFTFFTPGTLKAGVETVSLNFNEGDVTVVPDGNTVSVSLKGGHPIAVPGEPDLPYYQVLLVLPPGARAVRVRVHDLREKSILSHVRVRPYQMPEIPYDYMPEPVPESPVYYARVFPERPVKIAGTQYFRGIPIAVVRVYPVRYSPLKGTLSLVEKIDFDVLYESGIGGIKPHKQLKFASKIARSFLRENVHNKDKISLYIPPGEEIKGRPFKVSLLPSPSDPPVAEVIVATDELAPLWEDYALYRTILGIPTVVRTMSFIEANYSGVDRAEKLRNFVRDAYQNWGIIDLILGEDTPRVPARIVKIEIPGVTDPLFIHFPSDYYFGCLDGNWNADQDTIFGEPEDEVDFLPEVFVGRVPVGDSISLTNFIRKVETYETNPGNGDYAYLGRALFHASAFGEGDYMCPHVDSVATHFPSYFDEVFLCESEEYAPTVEEFVDSLYSGFNFVIGQSHGYFQVFDISKYPLSQFTSSTADGMDNWWNASIFHLVSCESFGFDFDCVGEHMIRSEGCAVAVMGTARYNWPGHGEDYQTAFFDSLFLHGAPRTLGDLFYAAAMPYFPDSYPSPRYRYIYASYLLMGDPAMLVWDSLPIISEVTLSRDTLYTRVDSLQVTVLDSITGSPLTDVLVTLYKDGEIYSTGNTNGEGKAYFDISPETSGTLTVSISGMRVLPRVLYLPVKQTEVALSVIRTVINDPDGDGIPEPQETLSIYPVIFNSGSGNTGAFTVYLGILQDTSYLTVLKDTVKVFNIGAEDSLTTGTPFTLLVSPFLPDSFVARLCMTFVGGDTLGVDTTQLILRSPEVSHYGHHYEEVSDTFFLYLAFKNYGGGDDPEVFGILDADGADFIVDSVYFGEIAAHSILPDSLVDPFVFVYNDTLSELLFTLKIGDERGIYDSCQFIVNPLKSPQNLEFEPLFEAIQIHWTPQAEELIKGYFVYRSQDSTGGFVRINDEPIEIAFFEDHDVEVGEDYFYRVTVVDTFWNESAPTSTIKAYSSLPPFPGWPLYLMSHSSSTPLVANLVDGNGGLEILTGDVTGVVRLFDKHGNLLPGWPIEIGGNVTGSPAAGDIDNDGKLEIIVASYNTDSNFVFALEGDATPVSGWPREIPAHSQTGKKGVFASPVVADLDGDSIPEVIVRTMAGLIYVWRGNGEGFLDSTGFFFDLGKHSYSMGGLSVGDIDGDGYPEIVAGTGWGELHVIKKDGTELPGFPLDSLTDILVPTVIADFEPDSPGLEIAVPAKDSVWLIDATGDVLPNWPIKRPRTSEIWNANPSVADVDGDGYVDLVLNYIDGIVAYDRFGNQILEYNFESGLACGIAIADLNVDGTLELFSGSNNDGLYGFTAMTGEDVRGFPIPLSGSMESTPVLADVDSNGSLDLVMYSGDGSLWVFNLQASYVVDSVHFPWPTHRHDIGRTGCFLTPQTGLGIRESVSRNIAPLKRPVLYPVKPSPFAEKAEIVFSLPTKSKVSLKVYNASGRLVRKILDGVLKAGVHRIEWDGRDGRGTSLPDGVYFVTLKTDSDFLRSKVLRITH